MIGADVFWAEIDARIDAKLKSVNKERLGTIVGFFDNGRPKVHFDGDTDPSTNDNYRRFEGYTPKIGDRVVLVKIKDAFVIYSNIV